MEVKTTNSNMHSPLPRLGGRGTQSTKNMAWC